MCLPQLDCCGAQEYLDWTNVTFSALHDVPDSCCLSSIAGCGRGVLDLAETEAAMKIHTGGCLDIFTARIQDNVGVVGGVGIGIGLLQANMIIQFVFFWFIDLRRSFSFQLLGMAFAFYLANTIKKEYETV